METLNIKKVGKSKFGSYIQLEDDSYKGTTEAVEKFLTGKAPCTINVEGMEKDKISRVKIMKDSGNQMDPIETIKPGEQLVSSWDRKLDFEKERQEEIRNEFAIKIAIKMIDSMNQHSPEKIAPTKNNLLNNAKIALEVLRELKIVEELPDY